MRMLLTCPGNGSKANIAETAAQFTIARGDFGRPEMNETGP